MVVWCQMLVKIMYMKKGGVQDRRSLLLFVDFALFRGPSFPPLFPHDAAERGKDISMLQKSQNLPVHHIRRRSSLYTSLSRRISALTQEWTLPVIAVRRARSRLTCQIQDMTSELCSSKIGIWRFPSVVQGVQWSLQHFHACITTSATAMYLYTSMK